MDASLLTLARRVRVAAVVLIVVWFFVPELQRAIPVWLPFLAFAALELQFLILGLRERGSRSGSRGRLPQESDMDELGGEQWLEPTLAEVDGEEVWVNAEGEVEEPWQPPERRRRSWGRLEGLAVVAALAFVLLVLVPDRGLSAAERVQIESRLAAEAGRIAGHRALVHCDARGETVGVVQHADGVAEIGGTNAYLTPDICLRLYRLAFKGDEGAFSQTARAIAVLAHEAWHLRGETDEGVVNCYAFQSGVGLGERLGLSEGTAARMMRQQLADNATYARSAPEYLAPRDCRNGGRLDLNPAVSRFP
jgi:hypothetical protein